MTCKGPGRWSNYAAKSVAKPGGNEDQRRFVWLKGIAHPKAKIGLKPARRGRHPADQSDFSARGHELFGTLFDTGLVPGLALIDWPPWLINSSAWQDIAVILPETFCLPVSLGR